MILKKELMLLGLDRHGLQNLLVHHHIHPVFASSVDPVQTPSAVLAIVSAIRGMLEQRKRLLASTDVTAPAGLSLVGLFRVSLDECRSVVAETVTRSSVCVDLHQSGISVHDCHRLSVGPEHLVLLL